MIHSYTGVQGYSDKGGILHTGGAIPGESRPVRFTVTPAYMDTLTVSSYSSAQDGNMGELQ